MIVPFDRLLTITTFRVHTDSWRTIPATVWTNRRRGDRVEKSLLHCHFRRRERLPAAKAAPVETAIDNPALGAPCDEGPGGGHFQHTARLLRGTGLLILERRSALNSTGKRAVLRTRGQFAGRRWACARGWRGTVGLKPMAPERSKGRESHEQTDIRTCGPKLGPLKFRPRGHGTRPRPNPNGEFHEYPSCYVPAV